jgi:hypothetical protein
MSKIEVNTVAPQCGTTLTLGESGDTVVLGTGASQSGFGRTGTVDWQTGSIKTGTFTAANGEGYFADTSSGGFTMNLPAGTAGNIVSVVDYTNTFSTGNLTITPNGSQKIGGVAASFTASTNGQSLTFVYVDDTEGWKNVQDSTSNAIGNPFLVASGGTETTSGNCKIHTFTGPGTFTVSSVSATAAENIVSYLVVAGGGGGASGCSGGGGGAGGFRELKSPLTPYTASPLDGYPSSPNRVTVTAQAYSIAVGGGGAGGAAGSTNLGVVGSVSTFSTITSAGGGFGNAQPCGPVAAGSGGSGGGGGHFQGTAGSGNTPPVTPSQGNNGANSAPGQGSAPSDSGGGGGGATTAAIQAPNPPGANDHNGGAGATTSITASPVAYAGGGGGTNRCGGGTNDTDGGTGGGGKGGYGPRPGPAPQSTGQNGTVNTGGGGGGGKKYGPCNATIQNGGTGGSGIVVIRYKYQ